LIIFEDFTFRKSNCRKTCPSDVNWFIIKLELY